MMESRIEYLDDSMTFHGTLPRVMGTRLEMLAAGSPKEAVLQIWNWLAVEAEHLDSMLNRFNPDSDLSMLNGASGGPVQVNEALADMIRIAGRFHRLTDGYFDAAKGGMDDIEVDDQGIVDLHGHQLDFGGLAKGCLLDRLKDRMRGITSAFVDFGGSSILAIGHHPYGDCWKVGVRDPFGDGVLDEIELKDRSMSTSGNTPGYEGHIVNPFNGKAMHGRKVVTAVAESPLLAEVLSTALMVADEKGCKEIIDRFPQADVRFFGEK